LLFKLVLVFCKFHSSLKNLNVSFYFQVHIITISWYLGEYEHILVASLKMSIKKRNSCSVDCY